MRQSTVQDARILIVDDQAANVDLLEALLQQAGYTHLKGMTDPRRAVTAFQEFQPDLVLLDLLMPYLNGFEVMVQLRRLLTPDTFLPILVLTADITPEVKRRALGDGATDFLSKPLDTTEVVLRIGNLLQTRRLHLQLQQYSETLEQQVNERTSALEEARSEILHLYQELAKRNQHLHDLVGRLLTRAEDQQRAAIESDTGALTAAVAQLTPREQEVLRLIARGQTNAEIAHSLVVSVATVKTHVEHIIAKLGVVDRTQAAVQAVEAGLLVPVRQ